jgi:hypothetical protein
MFRSALVVIASALCGVITYAAPAQASVTHYSGSEAATTEVLAPCGAVWTYSYSYAGRIVTTPTGRWREVRQDYYPGTITYEGLTYIANDRQTHTRYIDRHGVPIGTLSGQGLFTVLSGIGVAVFDVGRYVFNDDTGESLFASPRVIPFEQDFDFGAAICAALDSQ